MNRIHLGKKLANSSYQPGRIQITNFELIMILKQRPNNMKIGVITQNGCFQRLFAYLGGKNR